MVMASGRATRRGRFLFGCMAGVLERLRRGLEGRANRLGRPALAEPLEERRLLAVGLVISEFMASNTRTLYDEDGVSSDWIEIYNPTTQAVDLAGYSLTDNADNLGKWQFPAMTLQPGQHLLVFASSKDRTDPTRPLHTNFSLSGDGEYLGLVAPNGTVVHDYAPTFPPQLPDVSYGVAIDVQRQTLLTTSANVRFQVPQDDALGLTWTTLGYNDSAWASGRTGVGYEGAPPLVQANGFTVRMVDTNGGTDGLIDDIGEARELLNGTTPPGAFNIELDRAAVYPFINFGYGGAFGMPSKLPNGAETATQYALRMTTDVIIPAGNWSIRVNSENGFILRIPGVNFITRSGEDYTGTGWNAATVPADMLVHGAVRSAGSTTATFTTPANGIAARLVLDSFDGLAENDSIELLVGSGFTPDFYHMVSHGRFNWSLTTVGPGTLPYTNLIEMNVGEAMRNQNASAMLRLPFGVEFADQYDAINLRMRYDDGFVAFLNGHEVARRNAPELLEWNSTATAARPEEQAVFFEDIVFSAAGLLVEGTNILAIHGLNISATDEDFLIFPMLETLRITVGQERYFQKATPGTVNDLTGLAELVTPVSFSQERGFHDVPFNLSLSTTTAGAQIRYTLDGTAPTPTTGLAYSAPIHVNRTTTVRATAFKPGAMASSSVTHTYLFLNDVLHQSNTNAPHPGWPSGWGSNVVDYGMDPVVVAPSPATAVLPNGKVVFAAFAPATGLEPYVTDGTAAGTFMLRDIFSGTGSSGAGAFVTAGNFVYFRAADSTSNHELWRTDGTFAGTIRVRDIRAGSGGSYPNGLTAVGSVLYFSADDGSGFELWRSDSTTNTTTRVRDINTSGSSYPSNLTNVSGTLYFTAHVPATGWELYKSDGTTAGTVLVRDIRSGSASSSPMNLTAVGSTLFFTADDGSTGYELWKSGGTSATTVRVADINPGVNGSFPSNLTNVNGVLYFTAYHPESGAELWMSDGTETTLVRDIHPGPESSAPANLVNFGGVLIFSADDPVNGRELWRSNGTSGGTLLIRDIRPGTKGSKVANITAVGARLYFSADDGVNGIELWQSDGNPGNAVLAADIVTGAKGSSPSFLTGSGASVIFTTDTDASQRLWKYTTGSGLTALHALAMERDAGLVASDMKAIPTISIVMKLGDLLDPSTGIYANPSRDGGDGPMWEKPMSMELIHPDGSTGFQVNAGIRIRGGFSRSTSNPKHAFRIFFRSEYGDGKLNYPMFGPDAAQSFDGFDLRTFQNYSWSFQNDPRGIFMRDMLSRDLQLAMEQPAERGDYYHLYINGVYWGIFNSCERPEASYGATYFGGRKEDYDVIKRMDNGTGATDGNMNAWTDLWNQARGDMTSNANYQRILGNNPDGTRNPAYPVLLDVDNLIDYMLVIFYGGNLDAPLSAFMQNAGPNNFFAVRNRLGDEGFRFFVHDAEHTLLNVNEDRTGPFLTYGTISTSNPQYIFQLLGANAEFRLRVADRINKWFFNDGVLTSTRVAEALDRRRMELAYAVFAESARWGDAKNVNSIPYTQPQEWLTEVNRIQQSYIPLRTGIVFGQLRADGYYPSVSAPLFSQHGGAITSGFRLAISRPGGSGVIYYTTDGTDPRNFGGGIAGTLYDGAVPLTGATTVKARILDNGVWSAMTEARFTYDLADLRITEIMYNPAPAPGPAPDGTLYSRGMFEFVEVQNVGTSPISLGGAYFSDGIDFVFPDVVLAPGAYGLVVRNIAAFEWRYGTGLPILGEFANGTALDDSGESIELRSAAGDRVIRFTYDDDWYKITDGDGFSLVAENPTAGREQFNTQSAWRPSFRNGGSPAAPDDGLALGSIIISELLANSTAEPGDWVEFYNTTDQAIDISGWFLSDSGSNLTKYVIPQGTVIGPKQFLVFTEAEHFGQAFVFNNIGESVRLSSNDNGAPGGFRLAESFGASEPNVTFGLYVKSTGNTDFVALQTPTPGLPNSAARVGPVVMSELMYNPTTGGDEFIELKNIAAAAVDLTDWMFTAGVTFTFPAGATLAANAFGLVVGINPDTFRTKYSIDLAVPIWGPYSGALDNSGEAVEISRPTTPSDGIIPYVLVDRVKYDDNAPWPTQPDGNGPSLVRLPVTAYGNDVAHWTYGPVGGTPGGDPAIRTGSNNNNTHVLRLDSTRQFVQFFTTSSTIGTPALQVPIGQYNTLTFDLRGGNDTLIIDLLYGNPVPPGGIEYIGGDGTDTLRVDGKGGSDWIMAADGRVLVGSSFIRLTSVETVILNGGDGDDTLGVAGPIHYNVTITGGSGTDRLLVIGSAADDNIRLTSTQVFFGTGIATFSGFELYQVDGGTGADTLTIPGSLPFNPVFNGGGGDDALVIEGLMTIQPVFNGGDGFDRLEFAGTTGNDNFTLEPTRLLFGALAIGLSSINLVVIDGGSGNDTLTVTGPLSGNVRFVAGPGNDQLIVNGSAAADLFTIDADRVLWGLHSIAMEQVETVRINGGGGDDHLIAGPTPFPIVYDGGTGHDRLTIVGTDADDLITVTFGQVTAAWLSLSYLNLEQLQVDALGGDDTIVAAGSLSLAQTYNFGDGNDTLRLLGTGGPDAFILGATSITRGSVNIGFNSAETVRIEADAGADTFILPIALPYTALIDGGDGDDRITITGSAGNDALHLEGDAVSGAGLNLRLSRVERIQFDANAGDDELTVHADVPWAVTFNGGAGTDRLAVQAGPDGMSLFVSSFQITGLAMPLTYTLIERLEIAGGAGNDSVTFLSPMGINPVVRLGEGADTLALNAGAWTFGPELTSGGDGLAVAVSGSQLDLMVSAEFRSLSIANGGRVNLAAGGTRVLRTGALSIEGGGALDLRDNAMVVGTDGSTAAIAAVEALYYAGRNDGAWNGSGVISSTALTPSIRTMAMMLNRNAPDQPLLHTFAGQAVNANAVLFKYTYYGDLDFNGRVDGDDYFLLDLGYLTGRTGWRGGDVDQSGGVDGDDYYEVDRAFLQQTLAPAPSAPAMTPFAATTPIMAPAPLPAPLLGAAPAATDEEVFADERLADVLG